MGEEEVNIEREFPATGESNFRCQAKKIFLTYARCPATREEVLARLQLACDSLKNLLKNFSICQEHHKDGGLHLHALIELEKKPDIRDSRVFDLNLQGEVYHPTWRTKIKSKKDELKLHKYIRKEDVEVLSNVIVDLDEKYTYAKAMEEASNKDEFLENVKNNFPRDFCLNYDRLVSVGNALHPAASIVWVPKFHPDSFKPTDQMIDWVTTEMVKPERALALFLIGDSRLGKSHWARSLGKHIYMKDRINIDKWDDSASYIVLDDIPWDEIPNRKTWLTAQGECEITDKYRSKRTIVNYKPCIWLSNDEPVFHSDAERNYWGKNSITIRLSAPLF